MMQRNPRLKPSESGDFITAGAVFTGDILFLGGCGRFFDGTPTQMDIALNSTLSELPKNTEVYHGHN